MQKFNYHTHTYRCGHADMDYSEEEYIKDFIKKGFNKIAFTDHSPYKNPIDTRPKIRMDYSEKEEYKNKINELKAKYKDKIEIKSGLEVEYTDKDKDELLEFKKEFDLIILGQHYFVKNDNNEIFCWNDKVIVEDEYLKTYYEHIEKAVKYGIPDIIAHPDFYRLSRKEFNEADKKLAHSIGKLAEVYKIPLEMNLNRICFGTYFANRIQNNDTFEIQKTRLENVAYPCKEFWDIISNYDVKVVFGGDIHHRGQIEHFYDCIELAKAKLGEEIISKLKFVEDM